VVEAPGAPEQRGRDAGLEPEARAAPKRPAREDEGGRADRDEPGEPTARLEGVERVGRHVDVRTDRHVARCLPEEERIHARPEVVREAWSVIEPEIGQGRARREPGTHLGLRARGRGVEHEREPGAHGEGEAASRHGRRIYYDPASPRALE